MSYTKMVSKEDRIDLALLALTETMLTTIRKRSEKNPVRLNQIDAALRRIERIDRTYVGCITEDWQQEGVEILNDIESRLSKLYK